MARVDFIKFSEIKRFAGKAAKDGVSLKDTPSTIWFGAWEDGQLCGFAGLLIKLPKARFKGAWVLPEKRGMGYGQMLTEHRLTICKNNRNIKVLEAYSLHPNFFKDILGWNVKGQYKPGTWIVEKRL